MTREEAITNIKALDAVCGQKEFYDKEFEGALSMSIKALEQQKTGHWIEDEEEMECYCSECGKENPSTLNTNYCPNCGAKMVEREVDPVYTTGIYDDYGDMNVIIQNGTPIDKIRERISLEKLGYPPSAGYYKAIVKVLEIIDRYKAESEEV